jgi:hypothetical protein
MPLTWKTICAAGFLLISGAFASPSRADVSLQFDLGSPMAVGSLVNFDVSMTFHGNPATDAISILQIGVTGSDLALTANDTDYSRFSFTFNTLLAPSWSVLTNLSDGFGIAVVADPNFVDVLSPNLDSVLLGVISVNTAGLADGTYAVSLTGGLPGLNTDASGVVGGQTVDSFAEASVTNPDLVTVAFGQPDGVVFEQGVAAVPELSSFVLFSFGGLGMLLASLGRRRSAASPDRAGIRLSGT